MMQEQHVSLSVVTPTLRRPAEISGLLENLRRQTLLPDEVILVDGAPAQENDTQQLVASLTASLPFRCRYVRHEGGTAIQRNRGIEEAPPGSFIAFVDDDVRLEPNFLQTIMEVLAEDAEKKVGGVVGYRVNRSFALTAHSRWRWYQRLKLLSTYEPGRYDFKSGYPINANGQPKFHGVRSVDFMTTACAVWRPEVFQAGLRFDPFFRDYGVLEDAHFSLRAGRNWTLLQCGDARCDETPTLSGREDRRRIGYKCVVNYYYVFQDLVRPLTWRHKMRFWRFQAFELFRIAASAVRRRRKDDVLELSGRLEGFAGIILGTAP
jgi:GT2 family glycosyltransferase